MAERYVFELERGGYVQAGPYVPVAVLDHPEAVTGLHREFLRAGSEVVLALTYYVHREKLKMIGREGILEGLNRRAVQLAREVAEEGDALVAGNISNTWVYDHNDPETSGRQVRDCTSSRCTGRPRKASASSWPRRWSISPRAPSRWR